MCQNDLGLELGLNEALASGLSNSKMLPMIRVRGHFDASQQVPYHLGMIRMACVTCSLRLNQMSCASFDFEIYKIF